MTAGKSRELLEEALALERKAHEFRAHHKIEEAFEAYDHAAKIYRESGEHLKAAFCFASAATCWNIRTGWQPLKNAASRNEEAAREAAKARDYDYALDRFGEAALLYEKEGDFEKYSDCYYAAQVSGAKRDLLLVKGRKQQGLSTLSLEVAFRERIAAFFRLALNTLNRLVWGYGERPFRTFIIGALVILTSSLVYLFSDQVITPQGLRGINIGEALYFSIITFTTVGFGDYLPATCLTRTVASLQALSGILLTPLFLIGLTRRYLRINR